MVPWTSRTDGDAQSSTGFSSSEVGSFDQWASSYDSSALQLLVFRPAHDAVLDLAAASMPVPLRILDVGCGTGTLLQAAARRFAGAQRIGVDPSSAMCRECATKDGLVVIRAGVESLPFADQAFPLVLSVMSYRHWADPRQGLAEIARVLRPLGHLVVADVPAAPATILARRGRRRLTDPLRAQVNDLGLDVLCYRKYSTPWPAMSLMLLVAQRPF